MSITTTDPLTAWATASRDEVDDAWNAMYDALHPEPGAQETQDTQEATA